MPGVPHQRSVTAHGLGCVVRLPAEATIILETNQVSAEVRTLLQETGGAQRVLQVGVHLHLLVELLALDLHESGRHSLHVGLDAAEGDSTTADGILVFVSVNTSVHHSSEEIIEDPRQDLRG